MLLGIWMQYKEPTLESLQLTALRCSIDLLIITYSLTESHLLQQHTYTHIIPEYSPPCFSAYKHTWLRHTIHESSPHNTARAASISIRQEIVIR